MNSKHIKQLLSWTLLFSGYFVLGSFLAYFFEVPMNQINRDYSSGVEALLEGSFIGSKYPPLHILWCTFKWKIHNIIGIPYFHVSLALNFPIMAVTWHLIHKLSKYITTDSVTGKWAAYLFIFYPLYALSISMDVSLLTFTPFFLLFLIHLFSAVYHTGFESYRNICYSAIFLGIATLVRPNPLLIPLILSLPFILAKLFLKTPFVWSFKRVGIFNLIFLLVFAATISPWSIIVSSQEKKFIPISTAFYYGHRDGLRRFPPVLTPQTVNPHVRDFKSAIQFHSSMFKEHPGFYSKVWIKKILRCWYYSDSEHWNLAFGVINFIYLFFAIIGFCKTRFNFVSLFILFYVVYHWALSSAVLPLARYQVPLIAVLSIYTSIGARFSLPWIQNRFSKVT